MRRLPAHWLAAFPGRTLVYTTVFLVVSFVFLRLLASPAEQLSYLALIAMDLFLGSLSAFVDTRKALPPSGRGQRIAFVVCAAAAWLIVAVGEFQGPEHSAKALQWGLLGLVGFFGPGLIRLLRNARKRGSGRGADQA